MFEVMQGSEREGLSILRQACQEPLRGGLQLLRVAPLGRQVNQHSAGGEVLRGELKAPLQALDGRRLGLVDLLLVLGVVLVAEAETPGKETKWSIGFREVADLLAMQVSHVVPHERLGQGALRRAEELD